MRKDSWISGLGGGFRHIDSLQPNKRRATIFHQVAEHLQRNTDGRKTYYIDQMHAKYWPQIYRHIGVEVEGPDLGAKGRIDCQFAGQIMVFVGSWEIKGFLEIW